MIPTHVKIEEVVQSGPDVVLEVTAWRQVADLVSEPVRIEVQIPKDRLATLLSAVLDTPS